MNPYPGDELHSFSSTNKPWDYLDIAQDEASGELVEALQQYMITEISLWNIPEGSYNVIVIGHGNSTEKYN